ncbi:hypothetical protein IRB23M11_01340 [Alkalibacterium sp. m-11]|uniref:Uncharacterized protein n=1 Tax=Alkalibacterium indicireducens TaxID=398758 RepID=A0ABN1BCV1_9LACT
MVFGFIKDIGQGNFPSKWSDKLIVIYEEFPKFPLSVYGYIVNKYKKRYTYADRVFNVIPKFISHF